MTVRWLDDFRSFLSIGCSEGSKNEGRGDPEGSVPCRISRLAGGVVDVNWLVSWGDVGRGGLGMVSGREHPALGFVHDGPGLPVVT